MSVSALVYQVLFCKDAVPRAPGTKVDVFVEQAGIDFPRRTGAKTLELSMERMRTCSLSQRDRGGDGRGLFPDGSRAMYTVTGCCVNPAGLTGESDIVAFCHCNGLGDHR